MIIQFLVLGLCAGAISLTLSKGTIFKKARAWVDKKSDFFGELINCPYCTSHWVSFFMMLVFHPRMVECGYVMVDYLATGFALVALSAMTAGTIYRLFGGPPTH